MTQPTTQPTEQPIHLDRRHRVTNHAGIVGCGRQAYAADLRTTRYPTLVTCEDCRASFTEDEKRDVAGYAEPEGC